MRVTDDGSYIKFVPEQGFLWPTTTQNLEIGQRITPSTVMNHLLWRRGLAWSGLFSLCGTTEKTDREVDWRMRDRRSNVKVWYIDTSQLRWKTAFLNGSTFINYLGTYNDEVMVFKATELMNTFGLSATLLATDRAVFLAARDEWIALEWIPSGMVIGFEQWS